MFSLAVVIPTLNEAPNIAATLAPLQAMRKRGVQVIVADGGSTDATIDIARPLVDHVIDSTRGRAVQMNAGTAATNAAVLWFLHADTVAPEDADLLIAHALQNSPRQWGRFDVVLAGRSSMLPVIAWFMNRRSRLTGICTGDQAIFMGRDAFTRIGGFPAQPLMEDVECSRRLKRLSPPACISTPVRASGRRWDARGAWRTILLMWRLRFDYWRGVSPIALHQRYYGQ